MFIHYLKTGLFVVKSCLTFCGPMDGSMPGSSCSCKRKFEYGELPQIHIH